MTGGASSVPPERPFEVPAPAPLARKYFRAPGHEPRARELIGVARQAWRAAWTTARANPLPFALALTIMEAATLGGAGFMLPAAALAQFVVLRATLAEHPVWRLDHTWVVLAGALWLPELLTAAACGLVFVAEAIEAHAMGAVSAWFSLPLLAAPALTIAVACLRLALATAPAARGLAEPAAESWAMTRGRVAFMAGAATLALGPLVVMALLWPAVEPQSNDWLAQAMIAAAFAIPAFAIQGALSALLYQRWRSALRPDMRPSRHRSRRREPQLG